MESASTGTRNYTVGWPSVDSPLWKSGGLLLLCLIVVSIGVLAILDLPQSYENADLVTALNFVFITLISVLVSIALARSFVITAAWYLVWMGCASLTFGVTQVLAALLLPLGQNVGFTVHNGGALAGAICQVVSATLALRMTEYSSSRPWRRSFVLVSYAATLGCIALFTFLAAAGLVPAFFSPEQGFTPFRDAVLGTAAGVFAVAAAMYGIVYFRSRSAFVYWYCLSLGAEAVGLAAIFFLQPHVGATLGWAGRAAQQIGGIYLLVAAAVAVREARSRKVSLEETLAGLFRQPAAAYRLLFEAALNAIISTDDEGHVQLWNPTAERMFGYASSEAIGSSLSRLIVPVSRDDFVGQELEALSAQTQDVLVGEVREVEAARRDGEIFPALFSFSARKTGPGWSTSIIVRDLSKEKQAEERVRQKNAILDGINRVLLEALTCETEESLGRACLAVAQEVTGSKFGFIEEINAEGRLDGIAMSDAGWDACKMETPRAHRKDFKVHGIYGRVLLDGKGFFTNDPSSHPDGIGIPEGHPPITAFLGVPLKQGGKTIGMVAVGNREGGYRDEDLEALEALATAIVQALMRKRVEAERERLLVAEKRAREVADAAVRTRDEFLSVAAHELRTPVTSLRGFAQVLLRQLEKTGDTEPSRVALAMAQIDRQSQRLARLIDQLLDISRIQAGKLAIEKRMTDIQPLVEEVVAALQRQHPERQFVVEGPEQSNAIGGSRAMAAVDAVRLEQVITNLLDNAVKFSQTALPVEVTVASHRGEAAQIAVRDHGIGIPAEKRARIFERFYQAHEGEVYSGLGLGLFISQQIVELHGGSIAVECPADGGSRFTVLLPIGAEESNG